MAGGSRKTARQILHHHGRRIGQLRKQVIDSYPETQRQTNAEVRELAHLNSILLGPSNSLRSNYNCTVILAD